MGADFAFNSISPIMPLLQLMATEDGYLKRALQSQKAFPHRFIRFSQNQPTRTLLDREAGSSPRCRSGMEVRSGPGLPSHEPPPTVPGGGSSACPETPRAAWGGLEAGAGRLRGLPNPHLHTSRSSSLAVRHDCLSASVSWKRPCRVSPLEAKAPPHLVSSIVPVHWQGTEQSPVPVLSPSGPTVPTGPAARTPGGLRTVGLQDGPRVRVPATCAITST